MRLAESGVITTRTAVCTTVMLALAEAFPAVAVIRADPFFTAVTCPLAVTVATVVSLLVQVTPAPRMTLSSWSKTVAISETDSPIALSDNELAESVIRVGICCAGSVGLSLPQVMKTDAEMARTTDKEKYSRFIFNINPES